MDCSHLIWLEQGSKFKLMGHFFYGEYEKYRIVYIQGPLLRDFLYKQMYKMKLWKHILYMLEFLTN